jgi:hypothetical protein
MKTPTGANALFEIFATDVDELLVVIYALVPLLKQCIQIQNSPEVGAR